MIQKPASKTPIGTIFRLPGIDGARFVSIERAFRRDTHEPIDYVCFQGGNNVWEPGEAGYFLIGDIVLVEETEA